MRSLENGVPMAAKVTVPLVVGNDDDHVGFGSGGGVAAEDNEDCQCKTGCDARHERALCELLGRWSIMLQVGSRSNAGPANENVGQARFADRHLSPDPFYYVRAPVDDPFGL